MSVATQIKQETLIDGIREALARGRRKKFVQSIDLILVLRDIDLNKPENRISLNVPLPHPPKANKVAAFVSGAFETAARNAGVDAVIGRDQIEALAGKKREIRKLAKRYDYFIAPPDLMPLIGRVLGSIFGPRGKMPEVVPPNADVKSVVDRLKRSARVRLRNEPVIKVRVGSEAQRPEEVLANVLTILEEVNAKFPLRQHLARIYIKKTMGPPVALKELFAAK
ncbi:50S ribosomal protein L1 [Thermoproteus tenax]|uniref:Large ribosomal subunit protein uL1 n=1 Tax=Thermoproteus tenax (strain ATCC 35583 / DSM 2078 / JCM 9277 / NBRC 100435 / Kra 1) TaxID=768679 RepID=G4RLI1_THETK|nr:50S ribosomal protein L1 [Thermoproteus tenax]CCC82426.1 50S ribosomal protein L1p [Thermoproteus tenax Kra 1]